MDKRLKIVITDDETAFGQECVNKLTCCGMEVLLCKSDGIVLMREMKKTCPDVVLADIFMPGIDAFGILSSREFRDQKQQPIVMAMANYSSAMLEREIMSAGASCCFKKPLDAAQLAEHIIRTAEEKEQEALKDEHIDDSDLNKMITKLIQKIGIPANLKGYHYLREAISLAIRDQRMLSYITKQLYPTVARKFKTTPSGVEAAIRHSIEIAWYKGDGDVLRSQFGYTIYNESYKPTNSELIAIIADELRCGMKNAEIT